MFQVEVDYKTVYLRNQEYVKIPVSDEIPLDRVKGEDLASEVYGVPSMISISDIPDDHISVSLNELEIVADLTNQIDKDIKIDKIQLNIIKRHTAADGNSNFGNWNLPATHQIFESIRFEIDGSNDQIIVVPNQLVLERSSVETDRRLRFVVSTLEDVRNQGQVIEFQIQIEGTVAGMARTKVKLMSDKKYFIASK